MTGAPTLSDKGREALAHARALQASQYSVEASLATCEASDLHDLIRNLCADDDPKFESACRYERLARGAARAAEVAAKDAHAAHHRKDIAAARVASKRALRAAGSAAAERDRLRELHAELKESEDVEIY